MDKLGKTRHFSSIYLANTYHEARIAAGDTHKTAFPTNKGRYDYLVMPFGLYNTLATLQRLMNLAIAIIFNRFVTRYLNDILDYCETEEEHLAHIKKVFVQTRESQLQCKPNKYKFVRTEIKYLVYRIHNSPVSIDPSKGEAVKTWSTATCTREF